MRAFITVVTLKAITIEWWLWMKAYYFGTKGKSVDT